MLLILRNIESCLLIELIFALNLKSSIIDIRRLEGALFHSFLFRVQIYGASLCKLHSTCLSVERFRLLSVYC